MSQFQLILGIVVAVLVFLLGLGLIVLVSISQIETGSAGLNMATIIGGVALMGLSIYGAKKWALHMDGKLDATIDLREKKSTEMSMGNSSLAEIGPA